MATAPTLPLVTVEDYFKNGLWKEWEYDNGVLVPRHSGSPEHARLAGRLIKLLAGVDWLVPFTGQILSIPWDRRYRVPDVSFYPDGVGPGESLENQVPPAVIFEVLSPSDPMVEMRSKCAEYQRLGIPHIYIVSPADRGVLVPHGIGFLPVEKIEIEVNGRRAEISIEDLFGPA